MAERVDPSETTALLQQLVRARSENPPGSTVSCARVITELLDREGISYRADEPKPGVQSVTARLKGTGTDAGRARTFLLNGHIDTVPAGNGWTVDPYEAVIRDGYLYGRGATDMKAGVAASLMACVELNRKGSRFNGEVIFTAVADEEYHSEFGTKWLLAHGLTADIAVNCEPTNLDVCLGNRGLLMVDVVVKGRSSHGGRPGLGKNAVSIAAEIIQALQGIDIAASRDDNFKDPLGSLSVVGIHGGSKINVIPDRCEFFIDRRLTTKENSRIAVEQIVETVKRVTGSSPAVLENCDESDAEVLLYPEVWHEPFWMDLNDPFVEEFNRYYRRFFGREPVFEGKSAGTDASHLVTIGGIPTVIFGPGNYNRSHTVDERVELSQVHKAVDFYAGFIEDLLG
jgi:succinyl-diaminopimelate desuccinylase